MPEINEFLTGAMAMAAWVVGLFFFRFWRETRDRLFVIFAAAFWLMGLTRIGLALSQNPHENQPWLYWLRLVAFLLIIVAIVDKNRPRKRVKPAEGD